MLLDHSKEYAHNRSKSLAFCMLSMIFRETKHKISLLANATNQTKYCILLGLFHKYSHSKDLCFKVRPSMYLNLIPFNVCVSVNEIFF